MDESAKSMLEDDKSDLLWQVHQTKDFTILTPPCLLHIVGAIVDRCEGKLVVLLHHSKSRVFSGFHLPRNRTRIMSAVSSKSKSRLMMETCTVNGNSSRRSLNVYSLEDHPEFSRVDGHITGLNVRFRTVIEVAAKSICSLFSSSIASHMVRSTGSSCRRTCGNGYRYSFLRGWRVSFGGGYLSTIRRLSQERFLMRVQS
jgi:hypothetical protein